MVVELLLLMSCATLVNCQSTISKSSDATHEHGLFEAMQSEIESIHELLVNLQQSSVRSETSAMLLKSEIEDIRQTLSQQQYWSKNGL